MTYIQSFFHNINLIQKDFVIFFGIYLDYLREAFADIADLLEDVANHSEMDEHLIPVMISVPVIGAIIFFIVLFFPW